MKERILNLPKIYFLLLAIVIGSFFVRAYRLHDLLGFYYDQGRDALVIWKLWHEGKLFLIGPVTGLAGIFLGPFYYYVIAPFYLLGKGDPVIPALFLAALTTTAVLVLYILGSSFHSKTAGIVASVIGGFSYNLMISSRWLSNPTPLLLTSLLLVWVMTKIAKGQGQHWWGVALFLAGISLHFEAASAVFFIPMMLAFAVWQRKNLPTLKWGALAFGAYLFTLLPQMLFSLRHDNLLARNILKVLFEEKAFKVSFWQVLTTRLETYWDLYNFLILPRMIFLDGLFIVLVGITLLASWKKLSKNPGIPILILVILTPMLGFLAFQGNNGNVYGYYLTGAFLPFVLLFSIGLAEIAKMKRGMIVVALFFAAFANYNLVALKNYLTNPGDGPIYINFKNQLKAVDWVFQDATGNEFNVDVYVPPVIPYSYDYLFLWQGTKRCGDNLCDFKQDERLDLLYTLYEADPPHKHRLDAWLARQEGIGIVEETATFGGITVERRTRIDNE